MPFNVTAGFNSRSCTSSGMIACHAGAFMAAPSPSAKVSKSKLHGVIACRRVKAPSSAATHSIQPCVTSNRRRRSTTSATAPAGSPIRNTGKVVAACTSATMVGLGAKEVISQAAPTFCIQVPMFEATAAIQRARKSGWRSGAQVDACEGGSMSMLHVYYENEHGQAMRSHRSNCLLLRGRRPACNTWQIAKGRKVMAMLGLGHVGIYVYDLERMVAFYRDTLELRITKQNWRAGIVFLSADPERADHEIALFRGRAEDADSRVINQISLRVESLDDLRVVYRRLIDARLKIDAVVNHVSALGCYYFDPEGNRSEVFWVTGRECWVPIVHPIDIERPDDAVLAEVDALWERLRHVGMGERMANEPATLQLDG